MPISRIGYLVPALLFQDLCDRHRCLPDRSERRRSVRGRHGIDLNLKNIKKDCTTLHNMNTLKLLTKLLLVLNTVLFVVAAAVFFHAALAAKTANPESVNPKSSGQS